jgi:carbamoyltransferase
MSKRKTKIVGFQQGHDVSYCVLENGIPTIHEELERITRRKMEYGDGLEFFFSSYSDTFDDIKYFTNGNYALGNMIRSVRYQASCRHKEPWDRMEKIINKNNGKFYEFGHHLSHSANAFYTSDFDTALIISVDGYGLEEGLVPTTFTIDEGMGTQINRVRIFDVNQIQLGTVYNKSTKWIFGLSVGPPKGDQAGTVMAMAALGEPRYTDLFNNFRDNMQKLIKIANKSEQERFNVAASLQKYTENAFYAYIRGYIKLHNPQNLCFSGGVSLNSAMLGKIKQWFPKIKGIYCDPVPYDAGLSLGSARYLWHHVMDNPRINNIKNKSPYLGKLYTKNDIEAACRHYTNKIKITKVTDEVVLDKLINQKIVSVFGGRSESGRRALGNRSILADPRSLEMKKTINEKVKHRQWFRPFAPSILEERVSEWFETVYDSPYMSFAVRYKEIMRDKVPAVVHFDGTGRLQTVNKTLSPWYHGFISKWEKLTGIPLLLNTSFNDSEPIVETPMDAIKCFLNTQIDYIYFFDYKILAEKR